MISVSSIGAALKVEDKEFVEKNQKYLEIETKKISIDSYLSYEKMENINYLLPGDSIISFNLKLNDYYQTKDAENSITGSLSSISLIEEKDIIMGRMPSNEYEIVVDKISLNKFLSADNTKMLGIKKISELLERKVTIPNMKEFIIVGVVDQKSPSIYVNSLLFNNIVYNSKYVGDSNIHDYNLFTEKFELKSGRLPVNDYEVIVNIGNKENMPLNKQINEKVNGIKLTVVGYYASIYSYQYYFTTPNTIKYQLLTKAENIIVCAIDKDEKLAEFRNLNLNINDTYVSSKEKYMKSQSETVKNTILVSGIVLIISFVEIFLMIRASFLSRIKEIGIYRAIGVKKSDIYKMFFGEIFAITTLASIPGLILSAYILSIIITVKFFENTYLINFQVVMLSVICVYLFNLIIGLVPVFNTIRKTPSQILARHDLD